MTHRFVSCLLATLLGAAAAGAAPSDPTPIVIGTGPISGFSYPLGGELCRLYEKTLPAKATCLIASTDGSIDDIKRLRDGDISFAIVQSDVAAQAVTASGPFAGAPPFTTLRAIVGLYPDSLTILIRADGPIKRLDDMKGKRVAVGEPGMPEPLFGDLLDGLGWTKADLGGVVEMPRGQQAAALCGGKISAIALSAPHPNGFVRQALGTCPLTVLDLGGPALTAVLAGHKAFGPATIDLGLYGADTAKQVKSFGPRAVLVTTTEADPQVIGRILSAISQHTEDLKRAHPAFSALNVDLLASKAGLGVERHPIADKFFADYAVRQAPAGR